MDATFWSGKRVFVTGHTGFKGGWISLWLRSAGAEVFGYALEPPTQPNFYDATKLDQSVHSTIGDVRDYESLSKAFKAAAPDIAIHMAAQPIVRDSYTDPVGTYATNVMGTVHFLDILRQSPATKAALVVTSDKCYENNEWVWGYRENEAMGGHDPYSSSKGCAELVVSAYRKSFFGSPESPAVASARAGNVIGGGDWANHRLIPDFIRAIQAGEALTIRNPDSVRPWQHVLVPISGYINLCEAMWAEPRLFEGGWNFGPDFEKDYTVEDILHVLKAAWLSQFDWNVKREGHFHEARSLRLDSSKARSALKWAACWTCEDAIVATAEWYQKFYQGLDMASVTLEQIQAYTQRQPQAARSGSQIVR